MFENVRAIVFDAVGTLIHPEPAAPEVYAAVGRRFGSRLTVPIIAGRFRAAFAAEEALDRAEGLRTSEAREVQRWQRIVSRVLDDVADADACFRELFEHFRRPAAWRCDSEAAATVAALAERGYVLALASNYDARLRPVAAGLPALRPIPHLIISSEVGWRKPAPPFFAAIRERLGLPGQAILHVGDDLENDYEGARAAGLRAVLLDPRDRFREAAARRIQRLGELQGLPGVGNALE